RSTAGRSHSGQERFSATRARTTCTGFAPCRRLVSRRRAVATSKRSRCRLLLVVRLHFHGLAKILLTIGRAAAFATKVARVPHQLHVFLDIVLEELIEFAKCLRHAGRGAVRKFLSVEAKGDTHAFVRVKQSAWSLYQRYAPEPSEESMRKMRATAITP